MKLEDIKAYESIKDSIRNRAIEICTYLTENDLILKNKGRFDGFDIDENIITINLYESWAYGGYDNHSFDLDLETFTSDNWLEILTERTRISNENKIANDLKSKENERLRKIKEAEETIKKLKNEN